MKKLKLLSVILCFAVLMGVWGCNTGDPTPVFDELPPWSQQGSACTEIARYEFSRYFSVENPNPEFILEGEDADKGYTLTRSGSVTYTIKEGFSLEQSGGEWVEVKNAAHTLIKSEMTVTYKDDLNFTTALIQSQYAGKTDEVFSYVILDRYTLNSLFSYRTNEIGAQLPGDTQSYTLTVDYSGEFLDKRQAVLKEGGLAEKTLSIKAGEYFDSESIYFQVRAMNTVTEGGGTRNFSISLPFDNALEGLKKVKAKSAKQVTAAEPVAVELPAALLSSFTIPEGTSTESEKSGMFSLDCFATALSLTTKKPGHAINLYYSAYPVRIANKDGRLVAAGKVLAKVEHTLKDESGASYLFEYLLASYSNSN